MKTFNLTIVLISLMFCTKSFGQKKLKVNDTISFRLRVPLVNQINKDKPFNYDKKDNNKEDFTLNILEPGFKYIVVADTLNNVEVVPLYFEPYKKKIVTRRDKRYGFKSSGEIDKSIRSKLYNNKSFIISKDNFKKFAYKYTFKPKDRFSIGLLSLPFKFRPQDDSSFDIEFNLNSTLNYRVTSFYGTDFYFQIGAGIGSVGLNSSNADGIGDKPQDIAVISGLTGVMLQYKKVQAGIYIGVDHINNQADYQWKSNGNIWLGFGVGYELFKVNLEGESQKKQH